jgi:hypothetical protein
MFLSIHKSYPGNGFQHGSYTSLTATAAHMKFALHSLIPFLPFVLSDSTADVRDSVSSYFS